jgi:hypothetical protein
MARFTKDERQKIIDDYLQRTGQNLFIAAQFVDWLAGQPEHAAYAWFYGMDDETAAREHRINLARSMASGLRITANFSSAPSQAKSVSVRNSEHPAMISPMSMRTNGGGYIQFDPQDPKCMVEFRNEAAMMLRSWIKRYRVALDDAGIDAEQIQNMAASLDAALEEV